MRPSGARPASTMERYDSRGSTIDRHSDDDAPMFYGLCYCKTWAGRYLHAFASPSFPDAEEETEYRQHTYNAGRSFLVWMLFATACLYSALSLMTAYLTNTVIAAEQSRAYVYLAMRFGFVVACAVAGGALHCVPKMPPTVATLICVLLLYAAVIISYSTSSLVLQHDSQSDPPTHTPLGSG